MTKPKTLIVQNGAPVLREHAKEVPLAAIKGAKIRALIASMKKAMHKEEDGVAIAAPQIGAALRIFVVSRRVFELRERPASPKPGDIKNEAPKKIAKDMVFINPKIDKRSKDTALMDEGCLSVRWQYGKVKRSRKATVTAYDKQGKRFTLGGAGLLAQVFQHEIDHLDGILFIDKAVELEDLPPKPAETLPH